jgi:hypothetical protein
VSRANFSSSPVSKSFAFTGSNFDKNNATAVWFALSPSIDFIPLEIFNEFPNLNGILISRSNLPILKEELFTDQFKIIQFLDLQYNKITQIESDVFTFLPNLKWIYLGQNKIVNLNNLFEVWLNQNECADSDFGGIHKKFITMNETLINCYSNCLNDDDCASKV